MAAKNKSNELHLTRVYDAPVAAVWDAWVDPKQAAQWWGPRGFTLTTHSKDFRVGGTWVYTMHGPDGVDYPSHTVYLEIEKHARLVYDHGAADAKSTPLFRVTVLFKETKGGTKMDMTMTLPTPEAAEETRKFIKKAGGNATWDRLAEYLEKESSGKEQFVINRSFDAPIDRMFDLWTDPKHISQWLPPTGMTMKYLKTDIRAGGQSFYMMTGNGVTMYGRAEYLKIERPNQIVYTQQFCDEKENVTRHYLTPTFPETMLTRVTFSEEGPDKTRVTITWEAHGAFNAEELATFVKAKAGMTQGWTGSLDKLEGYLEKSSRG